MLYKILNYLFKLTQVFYFKKREVEGLEHIPKNEANILVANHPSAFKDPILIASNIEIPIYFLTAEEFMGGKKTQKFMGKQFNMIPIYRPSTRPSDLHKNLDSFKKCYEALGEHKSILIFGEGHSETQSWLDPLKTGAARIALEAVKIVPELETVNIIPVGLNYSNPHQFRSTFLLKIGERMKISNCSDIDKNEIMDECYLRLNALINGIDKRDADWLDDVLTIYETEWRCGSNLKNEFDKKNKAIKSIYEKDTLEEVKQNINHLKMKGDSYKELISGAMTLSFPPKINFLKVLFFGLICFPGYLIHLIPLKLTLFLVKIKKFKYSFEGSMYFGFGTLFVLLWYLLMTISFFFFIGFYCLLTPLVCVLLWLPALYVKDYLNKFKDYIRVKLRKEKYGEVIPIVKKISELLK